MTKRGLAKHPVEIYKHYTIYIVAGIDPAFFIAEKADPSKGTTLTADNIEQLKTDIDNTLDRALSMKINIWEGPKYSKVFQKPDVRIKSNCETFDGFAIVIECDYDLEDLIALVGNHIRVSKKYRKKNKHINLAKFYSRDYTLQKNKLKELNNEQISQKQAR